MANPMRPDSMLPGPGSRQMRSGPRPAGAKIIALAALRDEKGVGGCLAKPFALSDLRQKIEDLLAAIILVMTGNPR